MRITDLLKLNGISLDAAPVNKNDAIEKLADLMEQTGNLTDKGRLPESCFSPGSSRDNRPRRRQSRPRMRKALR